MRTAIWTLLFVMGCGGTASTQLTIAVDGGGSVQSMPAGIDCSTTCVQAFADNTSVTLTPVPQPDAVFARWSGDCAGTGPCTVQMDRARSVTASFTGRVSERWVQQVSYPGVDAIVQGALDPDGNLIVSGTVTVSAIDDSNPDLFVIKYARADGRILWSRRFDTPSAEGVSTLAVDAGGDIYVAASISMVAAQISFGAFTVTADAPGNIVVLRLSGKNGDVMWAQQWGGSDAEFPNSIALAGDQLIVMGITSSDPMTIGGQAMPTGGKGVFIAVASTLDGSVARARVIPGTQYASQVAVNQGHVAVSGQLSAPLVDGPCRLSPVGLGDDAMILDLDLDTLACQWAIGFGDNRPYRSAALWTVAAYPGGGWVAAGEFRGTVQVAPGANRLIAPDMGGAGVVVRFAADGAHLWSSKYDGSSVYAVATAIGGDVVIGGTFYGPVSYGPVSFRSSDLNAFVVRMSGDGLHYRWAANLGGPIGADLLNDIVIAPDETVFAVADFHGTTDIGDLSMTSRDYDGWIAALVH